MVWSVCVNVCVGVVSTLAMWPLSQYPNIVKAPFLSVYG